MIKITFLPNNNTFEIKKGISILEFARNNFIDIPSQCEEGSCYTCSCEIKKGQEILFENLENDVFDIKENSSHIITCITEVKENIVDGEIIINLGSYK